MRVKVPSGEAVWPSYSTTFGYIPIHGTIDSRTMDFRHQLAHRIFGLVDTAAPLLRWMVGFHGNRSRTLDQRSTALDF